MVAPGEKKRTQIALLQLADGTSVSVPVLLTRALKQIDLQRLAGSIVCVPVQHPLALHADHRLPLAQFLRSPLDQAPADAWTCFPGKDDGNLAQMVAATLFRLIRYCDYALDTHTPTRGGRYVRLRSCRIRNSVLRRKWHMLSTPVG